VPVPFKTFILKSEAGLEVGVGAIVGLIVTVGVEDFGEEIVDF
jgi:hypothetical protein